MPSINSSCTLKKYREQSQLAGDQNVKNKGGYGQQDPILDGDRSRDMAVNRPDDTIRNNGGCSGKEHHPKKEGCMADKSKQAKKDSPLVEHARREMEFVGLFDEDSDYGGMIPNAVLELMEVFSKQGHSGYSASLVGSLWYRLMQFKPLTEVTLDPKEWIDVSENMLPPEKIKAGERIWQNIRSSSVFSTDGGKAWKDYDSNTEGKSITKEEALNGVGKETKQGESEASGGSSESTGVDEADSSTGVQGESATESKDSTSTSPAKEPGHLEGSEQPVEGSKRPDSSKGKVK